MSECLFCKIAAGEIPAQVVFSDEAYVAFRDIDPQAPHHVLVIPRAHVANVADYARADAAGAGALLATAASVAEELGLSDYRLVTNTGPESGQSVFHLHVHVLGGRPMRWPPG